MAEYTVAEMLAAVRKDHPEFAKASDKELYQAMSVDHPDIVKKATDVGQVFAPESYLDPTDPHYVAKATALEAGKKLYNVAEGAYSMFRHPLDNVVMPTIDLAKDALTGNASGVVDKAKGMLQPVTTSARGAAAYVAPHTVNPPSEQEMVNAARGAGQNFAATAAPIALEEGLGAANAATSPERLRNLAAKVKEIRDNPSPATSGIVKTIGGAVGAGIGHEIAPGYVAPSIGAGMGVHVANDAFQGATGITSRMLDKLAAARESLGAPHFDNPALDVPTEPSFQPDTGPAIQSKFYPEAQNPIVQPGEKMNIPRPQPPELPAAPEAATAGPLDTPIPGVTPDVALAREALLEDGKPRTPANIERANQNATYLLDAVPELRGLKPGLAFNTRLYNALDIAGKALNAEEGSIPRDKPLATKAYADEIGQIADQAAVVGNSTATRAAAKLKSFLEGDDVTWGDFIKNKRDFYKEVKLTSATGKAVYDVLKQISDDVSPKLTDLNQKWFTIKTAAELADVSPFSGEKLRQVAKDLAAKQKARAKQ